MSVGEEVRELVVVKEEDVRFSPTELKSCQVLTISWKSLWEWETGVEVRSHWR